VKLAFTTESSSQRGYIQQMNLRSPITPRVYRCILNGFHRFVAERTEGPSISQETIRQWLNDRILVWPFHLVAHRARLVDRFLDWMVKKGVMESNPFADLKTEYGQRSTTPVVRALLNADFRSALDALRPVPRFGSFLGPFMLEHINLMKTMGYRYNVHEERMLRLDRFLQGRADLSGQPLTTVIREWTNAGSTPQHAYECHATGRSLSRAILRLDPTAETIAWDKRISREARKRYRQPYIFSEQEIHSLLETALSFPSPRSALRPRTLHTMLVLAYCAGLRIGELIRLNVGDVDLEGRAIEIRGTKFFKTRRLPLSNSAASTLRSYLDTRNRSGAPDEPSSGLFWHHQPAGRYSRVMVGQLLIRVFRRAGIKPQKGKVGPRIHDLRHAFVCHRMLAWYREGVNPQSRLPYLATYLGHKDINSTLVYLTITQELLQHASERFRQYGAFAVCDSKGGDE
jgi:integrase/recombinase XerD